MRYLTFISREVWPAFNSLYAHTKIKGKFPEKIIIFYNDEKKFASLKRKIEILYGENEKAVEIMGVKLREDISGILKEYVKKGDVIDITGARKSMILSLMDIRNVRLVYLLLKDMRFSSHPFMMRLLSLQELMEVER